MELDVELHQFISNVEQLIPSINDINEEMLDILSLFIFHHQLSIYQIHKIIEKHSRKMTYKNTHKKVVKIIDLNLIEKVTDFPKINKNEIDRGAKYYKLSEGGIFALFYNSNVFFKPSIYYVQRAFENGKTVEDISDIFVEYKKEIFKNHQNSSFFTLFLFPWISRETIERADDKILDNVIESLNECCNIVKNYILNTSLSLYIIDDINTVEYLFSEIINERRILGLESVNVDDKNLLSYIQNFFFNERLWTVRIKRDNKNNILLSQRLFPRPFPHDKLFLAYKDKENNPNIISFYNNIEGSSLFNYSLKHKQILNHPMFEMMEERINLKSLYLKAVSSMVMGLSKDDDGDLKLLKEDVKFMNTSSELKERFNEGYELLAK